MGLPPLAATLLHGQTFFPLLWTIALACLWVLLHDDTFHPRRLWNGRLPGGELKRVLWRFAVMAPVLAAAAALESPERFLIFVRNRPALWAAVMVLYPLLSVYPQGIVYRAFLLHRYRAILPSGCWQYAIAAAVFSFSHIIFRNPVALAASAAGGLLFVHTYHRSQSLWLSCFEHALYGNLLFTVGLGRFLYHGNIAG